MNNTGIDISSQLQNLLKSNRNCEVIQRFVSKENWSPKDRDSLLTALSDLLVTETSTSDVVKLFRPLLLDLLHRARWKTQQNDDTDFLMHQKLCIALSHLVSISREVRCFAYDYLCHTKPFYGGEKEMTEENRIIKRPRLSEDCEIGLTRKTLEAVYRLVRCFGQEISHKWNASNLLHHLSSTDVSTKWCVVHCVAHILGMSAKRLNRWCCRLFTEEQRHAMYLRYDSTITRCKESTSLLRNTNTVPKDAPASSGGYTKDCVLSSDLSQDVISVCGVLLPVLPGTSRASTCGHLTMVPSTCRNLQRLALAVSEGEPVLLEGPVGCGKTSLVEHLASLVGRTKCPQLLKLQLGEQTDSKALIGTYRCSDIPGQFLWQPGCLVSAVQEGYWLLLEDLDYAPMDVVSVLVPLLETGSLVLPGCVNKIAAAPGFRIFATQRLVSSRSGWHRQHSCSSILERLWRRIRLEPLSRDELKQVITDRFHSFQELEIERLLDVYFLLASGQLDETEVNENGRPISTRDLMKCCRRIADDLSGGQLTSKKKTILVNALDCFASCLPLADGRMVVARVICNNVDVPEYEAENYYSSQRPMLRLSESTRKIGRVLLECSGSDFINSRANRFAMTFQAHALLEQIGVCVRNIEPVLLVGETGTGKTSIVQYMADLMGQKLHVINMNQQSDMTDLLGGYKPVDLQIILAPVLEEFEELHAKSFSTEKNRDFFHKLEKQKREKRWKILLRLVDAICGQALNKCQTDMESKRDLHAQWSSFRKRVLQLLTVVRHPDSRLLAFAFIEGVLVKALKNGSWVLLDEINLATAETLECLSGLLESRSGSVVLTERGDTEPVERHPNFRLFACMNPAADVGKKDLPLGIRNRFTEMFVDELEKESELATLVKSYMMNLGEAVVQDIVSFYQEIRKMASTKLVDGTGHHPHYSLRTLCRALRQAVRNLSSDVSQSTNVRQHIYEAFRLSFLTQLDRSSYPVVDDLIRKHILRSNIKSKNASKDTAKAPRGFVNVEGYMIAQGDAKPFEPTDYIMTKSVLENLRDIARVVSAGKLPVLIQGETSVGKTSLITYLGKITGNTFYRINNHEHTDIQEYIGCYTADETGKLVFREGLLVEAMRKGYWIILDELNLAPTDVLEAVNRLLDDNRELFIPETQEVVQAHPRFILFATQNPPGLYGGRKVLSRAFRNRFVELHFDTIPNKELEEILHQRCQIAKSQAEKLVKVMSELQTKRRNSGLFAGKQGFITFRDLFRWAERYHLEANREPNKSFGWNQLLADNGYMLLAGRVRQPEEEQLVIEVIENNLKCKIDPDRLFSLSEKTPSEMRQILERFAVASSGGCFGHVVWTRAMCRMAVLVAQALKFKEPVLLVGETGCGKTTVCQVYAQVKGNGLHSVNCHLHSESSDFLGGLRPVRHKSENDQRLFEWCDGPLVIAMKEGSTFLIDEISLADDSVLERLNSVLETERTLLLVEKGSGPQNEVDKITAESEFRVVATMNPGGDYGKKELSPALRNRFTEIWCPPTESREDLIKIVEHNLKPGIRSAHPEHGTSGFGSAMLDFTDWLQNQEFGRRRLLTIRDLLSWITFINKTARVAKATDAMETDPVELDVSTAHRLDPAVSYVHGAFLVFVDCLVGSARNSSSVGSSCLRFLMNQLTSLSDGTFQPSDFGMPESAASDSTAWQTSLTDQLFGFHPFYIARGPMTGDDMCERNYAFGAPTTARNALRVMRALQLSRPILLEGSPGVGKTSLVAALAKAAGHPLVRINLSEQTDVTDLFGADLPVEGGKGGEFAWRDGPFLSALKAGHWVVLDELNLASQSVLEGLNACFDHRAEVFIPELGMSFNVQHEKTRIFACQNPLNEGGGRKGLPKSFLNRFTQVYVDALAKEDLLFIARTMYPQLANHEDMLTQMVEFNQTLYQETVVEHGWGQKGGPWEFNLRDLFRWCDLMIEKQAEGTYEPDEFIHLLYVSRMRTVEDRARTLETFTKVFGRPVKENFSSRQFSITHSYVQVGNSFLERREHCSDADFVSNRPVLRLLHHSLAPLSALMKCIEMNWMAILVGSSCTGKTSLVELLARLTGAPLKILPMNSETDTTELLGGFEQSNLRRRVEALDADVKSLLEEVIAWILSSGNSQGVDRAKQILDIWNEKPRLPNIGETLSDVGSDVELVVCRLKHLDRVIKFLKDFVEKNEVLNSYSGELLKHEASVTEIERLLEMDKSLNHGGRFEWIDSTLVQCLKEGTWLLVDNVNFCCASVLDRLNALVEPNGVLTISERGAIDGTVPSIEPHKNFRLILSMDPRHGEISRAMRNRGIEIYIPGENDGEGFDRYDIKSMLHDIGVVGRIPSDVLISIHDSLCSQFGREEHFGIAQLLQSASLASQMMERGSSLATALEAAFCDVYGQPANDRKRKMKIIELVCRELPKELQCLNLPDTDASGLIEAGLWPLVLPNVSDWADYPVFSAVRLSATLVLHLVDVIAESTAQDHDLVIFDTLRSQAVTRPRERAKSMLHAAGKLLLEGCSVEGLPLLVHYVKETINGSEAVSESGATGRLGLVQGVIDALNVVQHHRVIEVLKSEIEQLPKIEGVDALSHLPVDWRWNESMVRLIRASYIRSKRNIADEKWNGLAGLSNQIYLVYEVTLMCSALDHHVTAEAEKVRTSFLKMSLDHQTGKLDSEDLPDESLKFVAPFLSLFLPEVLSELEKPRPFSDAQVQEVMIGLQWLKRFLLICCQPIEKQMMDAQLSDVALHWNWLSKRLISLLASHNLSFSKDLQFFIHQLDKHLGADGSAYDVTEVIRSRCGHVMPFRTEAEAAQCLRIEAISDCGDLCARLNQNAEEVVPLMKFASNDRIGLFRVEIVRALSHVHWTAASDLTEILLAASHNLEAFLEKTGFQWVSVARCGNTGSLEPVAESVGDVTSVENARINLWPIFGLIAALEEGHLVSKQLMTSEEVSVDFESLVRFACHRTALSAMSLVPMALVGVTDSCKVFDGLVMSFLSHLKSNEICLNRCLQWKPDIDQFLPDQIANSVFCASMSYAVFNLLTRDEDGTSTKTVNPSRGSGSSAWLGGNCSLNQGHERQGQVAALNATLWTHLSLIGDSRWNHRVNGFRLLEAATNRLVASVQSFFPSGFESLSLESVLHLLNDSESCSQSPLSLLLPDWNRHLAISLSRMEDLRSQGLEHWRAVMTLGEAWARIGVLQAHLQAPRGPSDPNQKLAYELQHSRDGFEDVKEELDVRRWYSSIVYGGDCNYLHPLVQGLVERQRSLEGWIKENCGKVAYRPPSSQFLLLLKETKRHLTHDVASVERLVQRLWSAFENSDKISLMNTVNDVDAFSRKCETVIDRLQKNYPIYRDVLGNFVSALRQIQFGLDSMAQAARAKTVGSGLQSVVPSKDFTSLDEIVGVLGSFPAVNERVRSTVDLVERLLSKDVMETVFHLKGLPSTNSFKVERPSVLPRLIQIALLHLSNAAVSNGSLDRSMVRMFEVIFKHYVASWRAAEDEKRMKEEEDASLFLYIGDTLTEEEKDELEIKARFPSFEADFDDIRVAQSFTNTPNNPVIKNRAHDQWGVTDQEMENVAAVHQSIFIKLTRSSWHQVAHESPKHHVDRLLPALQSYEIAAEIVKANATQLSLELEEKLLGGHLLVSAVSCGTDLSLKVNHQEVMTSGTMDPVLWTPSRPYDVYYDANVEKVLACRPVLDRFLARINELLVDWPENPTLETLMTIVSRINSFPVTSSLMRFTTGLEMLLESAQEWQKNAASHVSLAANLEEVTQLIVEWRKLELGCWKACLDVVAYKAHQRASRWWFHVYKLVEPYLQQRQEPRPEEEELSDLRKTLNEFLESSPAGEYVSRLQIVLAFHCHLLHAEPSHNLGRIQSIFWNVCQFYKQFLPNVQGFVVKSRTPIEKELKDYVKIARWDDKNFYHVQSAVYKSHKTLHRHMKQFERILRTSISAILTENSSENETSSSANQNGSAEFGPSNVSLFVVGTASPTAALTSKVSHKSRLMINFCHRIMSKMPYERLVNILDDFTGNVIDGVRQMQSLSIDHITDKEKQRSEVKHICQQKKMALTDLFRHLRTMGLSYQKGLVEINASEENRFLLDWFTQSPCDVKVALSQLPADQCDSVTSAAWHGCDKYLVRALNRRTLFHSALLTPSKELGMNVVERSKGFSEHLSLEVHSQRRHLVTKIHDFVRLRKQMEKLSCLKQSQGCVVLPPQEAARIWQERLKSLLERVLEFVQQLNLLLHCAPSVEQDLHQVSPVAADCLPPMATACRSDRVWSEGVTQLKDCEEILCKTLVQVRTQLKSDTFLLMEDISSIHCGFESLKEVANQLSCVKALLYLPSSENHGIATSIVYNISEILNLAVDFERFLDVEVSGRRTIDDVHEIKKQSENDPALIEFSQKVDRVMCKCLKVVEDFLKKANLGKESLEKKDSVENSSDERLDGEEADGDDSETDGLLTNKIGKMLTEDVDALNLDQVNQCLEDLISSIISWTNDRGCINRTHLAVHNLSDHLPIFEQYTRLVQYVLTQRIAGLRASTKLLTVLLEVFRGLAQKGFCLPEGFSDEMAQEGATEFEDMEGGGIGEGEGMKDVSDQIDNEGQVEGLEQDKKDDANDQNLPDIASEDNAIEMSEEFDGKTHDLEKNGEEDEENENDKNEEEAELDRKMGDLGEEDVDKLDEKLWGSDEEEEVEHEKKEEFGKGDGEQSKSELGAKDDRCEDAPDDKKEPQNEDDVDAPPDFDDDGAEDEHLNQPRSDVHAPEDEDEPMELPDDLNLDGGDEKEQEEGPNQDTEAEEQIDAEGESMEDASKDAEDVPKDAEEEEEAESKESEKDAKKDQPQEPDKEQAEEQAHEQEQEEGPGDTEANAEEQMDGDQDQKPPVHQPGYDAKENNDEEAKDEEEKVTQDEDESTRKTEHGTVDVQEMDGVKDTAGVSDETKKEENAAGAVMSEEMKGEEGGESEMVAQGGSKKRKKKNRKKRRREEQASNDRSLGTKSAMEQSLKTIENTTNESDEKQEPHTSDVYEHIKDAASQSDAQTLDAATEDQLKQQQELMKTDEPKKDEDIDEDIPMEVDEDDDEPSPETKAKAAQKLSQTETKESDEKNKEKDFNNERKVEVSGDRIETATVERSLKPSVHTVMENYSASESRSLAVESLRKILERERDDLYLIPDSVEQERKAEVLWQQCESMTSQLSQELCEQLRLILEPTQASKLRGDYRTGKRINMRKIIPYVASQFRKDKIWLRRTKPSKRQYQVLIAVDDSQSMEYNDSRQLAYESLAVISNALMKLEVGDLSVCSFGESVRILHPFKEPFTAQSGAKIIQQLQFQQNHTQVIELLEAAARIFGDMRQRIRGDFQNSNTAQLLLIVSDGRLSQADPLVKDAIQILREANIFVLFVVLDSPVCEDSSSELDASGKPIKQYKKGSVLDIISANVVETDNGKQVVIRTFVETFPFPFYIILRDVHTLPQTLSDALRQWFELVTASDL